MGCTGCFTQQVSNPQPCDDQQLNDQELDAILRGRRRVVCARLRPYSNWAFTSFEYRSEDVPIDGTRQAARDPHGDADVRERGGHGAVPIFAPGKVGFEDDQPSLDGGRLGGELVALMPMIGEDVIFRHRIAEVVRLGEAGEGWQILGIGPQGVMSDAALIAARVDESCVIEVRRAELLWWGSASSA